MDGRVPTRKTFLRDHGVFAVATVNGKVPENYKIGYSGEDDAWWVWFKGGKENIVDLLAANLDVGCRILLDDTEYTVTEHWFVRNSKKGTVWLSVK
jgi:hypothetical protein